MKLIDVGYLGWSYMAFDQGLISWNTNRFKYEGSLFCLDCHPLWRAEFYPDYKSRRAEKRALRPDMEVKAARVKFFRGVLEEDPLTQTVTHPHAEADDIIAALWIKHHSEIESVIGVDKDLFQVPGLMEKMRKIDGSGLAMWTKRKSGRIKGPFPKFVQPLRTSGDFLFTQTLLGDKSDSVPRLLPPYNIDLYWKIRRSSNRWEALVGQFGPQAERNLRLLILPGQFMWIQPLSYQDLYTRIQSGQFWAEPDFFLDVDIEEKCIIPRMEREPEPTPPTTDWVENEGDEW